MKKLIILVFLIAVSYLYSSIDPKSIFINGLVLSDSTKVQLLSEVVIADVYKDSAYVECNFVLKNHSGYTKLLCGSPFQSCFYFSIVHPDEWKMEDKMFRVWINENEIETFERYIPNAPIFEQAQKDNFKPSFSKIHGNVFDSLDLVYLNIANNDWKYYNNYVNNYLAKVPSADVSSLSKYRFSNAMHLDKTIWDLWYLEIDSLETINLKVKYKVPSGSEKGRNRSFKYTFNTGSGWYSTIENANVIININDIDMETIEKISPENSIIDSLNQTISWKFTNIEPVLDDNIYIRYFDPEERKDYEKNIRKWKRKIRWYFLNYINPIYWIKRLYWYVFGF